MVQLKCQVSWRAAAANHRYPVEYLDVSPGARTDLQDALALNLPWHPLMLQRSLCRLRADLISFGHLEGMRTRAKRQRCIFCDMSCLSLTYHVLCRCSMWEEIRAMFWSSCGRVRPESLHSQVLIMLRTTPLQPGYGAVLALAGSLDRDARQFWAGEA